MPKTIPLPADITEVVFVEWVDPCAWNKGVFTMAEAIDLRPHTLRSAGMLVHEDEEAITLANDVDLKDESVRFVQAILKRNIIAMKRWRWREEPQAAGSWKADAGASLPHRTPGPSGGNSG